jgi:hypothetical protein
MSDFSGCSTYSPTLSISMWHLKTTPSADIRARKDIMNGRIRFQLFRLHMCTQQCCIERHQ